MVAKKDATQLQNGGPEIPKPKSDGKVEPPYTGWEGETPGLKGGDEEG